ncbi:4-hydroxy-3-polyprenylbenzoate decarboxylase [Fictibacillus enclensis]|uniref:Probable UbiX-like flavin prenyltransferase n=1 Tax=Fictibacillus enclensis TaxID=1017270 RepID=A0A0V8JE19_9BACL|nr:UbiX family flavin prenyltransferase [Fictibacillus enclensis]KSU85197.1 phenolic acid decarboxylase [Fictibacillus enclensis]SCB92547.1 4-hydroxy-3-polyprenylbenzoate decarboxylase [Fictibacillus enclensis]
MRIIVGITGSTGVVFGIRILQLLKQANVETHLVMSAWATANIPFETSYTVKEVEAMADFSYSYKDQAARISSGSFLVDGMIVAPCSMKSLASIRMGLADNLLTRAADVMMKERKKLLLMTRETPLNTIHLENMMELSRMGTIIFPPMPAFYNHPQDLGDMVDHIAFRALDQFNIHLSETKRWEGMKPKKQED